MIIIDYAKYYFCKIRCITHTNYVDKLSQIILETSLYILN